MTYGGDETVVFVHADEIGDTSNRLSQGGNLSYRTLARFGAGYNAIGLACEQRAVGVSGPGVSRPAIGWPPTKSTESGSNSSAHSNTWVLVLPTSVTDAPFRQIGRHSLHQLTHCQYRGCQHDDVRFRDGVAKTRLHPVESLTALGSGTSGRLRVRANNSQVSQRRAPQGPSPTRCR